MDPESGLISKLNNKETEPKESNIPTDSVRMTLLKRKPTTRNDAGIKKAGN